MATEPVAIREVAKPSDDRKRSVVDGLIGLVDVLPGAAAIWYAVFVAALIVADHAIAWATGAVAIGAPEPEIVPPALLLGYFLWLLHALNGLARSVFEEFRPAFGGSADEQAAALADLTSIQDLLAFTAVVLVEICVNAIYWITVRPQLGPLPAVVETTSSAVWALVGASFGILILQALRQLRSVSRLSALARNVDIFKPEPINALARLTAASAIGILVFVVVLMLITPNQSIAFVVEGSVIAGLATASFVLPLRVMHARLVDERKRLLAAAQDRLKTTLARIHTTVDSDDLSRADELQKTLTSQLSERDVLLRLPTWPWSTGTFRGFASAVLLPIVIWLVIRVLERVV